jgi:signal recognition particle subunit SRP54
MFEKLNERLDSAFKIMSGNNRLTELNVATAVKEIRRALVEADVNYKIAKEFTDKVREKALGTQNVLRAVQPGQLMVKIVSDELTELMGGEAQSINLAGHPAIILVAGLQGSGKTTFCGKLALHLKTKHKKRPLLVACDVYRPAAVDQLTVLSEQVNAHIYKEPGVTEPVEIALRAIAHAKQYQHDVVIIDTAGRLSIDEAMMQEVQNIKTAVKPNEILFVVDAMTGQDAVTTAENFNDRLNFDGVVLTKLDGDTRGGAALSIRYQVGKPIKFASVGEKMDALDIFYPERMAQRILGMGDVVSLVERAQEQFDEVVAKKLESKFKKNTYDFNDFLEQLAQVQKLGDMKTIMNMIPGMSKQLKGIEIDERALDKVKAIIYSMTPFERLNPDAINAKRKERIAKGSGRTAEDLTRFFTQFNQMRSMMHSVTNGKLPPGVGPGGAAGKGGGFMNRR